MQNSIFDYWTSGYIKIETPEKELLIREGIVFLTSGKKLAALPCNCSCTSYWLTSQPRDIWLVSPDEERDDFPAFLDYDSYIQIIINSRSLIKAVHIVCILLQLTTIMKKRGHLVGKLTHQAYNTTNTMVKRAWRVLIRSSQTLNQLHDYQYPSVLL